MVASTANDNRQPIYCRVLYGSICVCVWCKCTIKENLQQSWLDCRSSLCTSYLENVDKLVFVANNVCFFEIYKKECGKLVKTATKIGKSTANAT